MLRTNDYTSTAYVLVSDCYYVQYLFMRFPSEPYLLRLLERILLRFSFQKIPSLQQYSYSSLITHLRFDDVIVDYQDGTCQARIPRDFQIDNHTFTRTHTPSLTLFCPCLYSYSFTYSSWYERESARTLNPWRRPPWLPQHSQTGSPSLN